MMPRSSGPAIPLLALVLLVLLTVALLAPTAAAAASRRSYNPDSAHGSPTRTPPRVPDVPEDLPHTVCGMDVAGDCPESSSSSSGSRRRDPEGDEAEGNGEDWSFLFSFAALRDSIWNQVKRNLQNDFIGGSLILTVSGFLAAILYKVTNDVHQFLFNMVYLTIEVNRGTEPYYWITNFIVKHQIVQRSSRFMVALDSTFVNRNGQNQALGPPRRMERKPTLTMPKVSLLPVGTKTTYKYLFQNAVLWITVEGDGHLNVNRGMFLHGRNDPTSASEKAYTLQVFNLHGLGQPQILSLLKVAHEEYVKSNNDTVEMYVARHGNWERIGAKAKRSIESVILDRDQASRILKDSTEFLADQEWYTSRGIPYRRGYLLSGPPGVGKTSLIFALAGELGLCVCIIPLNSPDMDGYTLSRLLNTAPENGIIVLEDIDAAFGSREEGNPTSDQPESQGQPQVQPQHQGPPPGRGGFGRNSGRGGFPGQGGFPDPFFGAGNSRLRNALSLSDLLNGIDGITGQEGRLLFMTTNHPEHLDPALVRPGRVDVHEKFHLATTQQIEKLFQRFFHHEQDVAQLSQKFAAGVPSEKHSMAKIQGFLMNYRHTPTLALDNVAELAS